MDPYDDALHWAGPATYQVWDFVPFTMHHAVSTQLVEPNRYRGAFYVMRAWNIPNGTAYAIQDGYRLVYNPQAKPNAKAGYFRDLTRTTAKQARKGMPQREWRQIEAQCYDWLAHRAQVAIPFHLEPFQDLLAPQIAFHNAPVIHEPPAPLLVHGDGIVGPVLQALAQLDLQAPPPPYLPADNEEQAAHPLPPRGYEDAPLLPGGFVLQQDPLIPRHSPTSSGSESSMSMDMSPAASVSPTFTAFTDLSESVIDPFNFHHN